MLENVSSAPTRALLKQWANPVKIAQDETILTMKSEIFLNQVQSGAKKQSIIDAVNALFSQTDSNVLIRLPQAGDDQVKPAPVKPVSKPVAQEKPVEKVDEQEVEELKEELKEEERIVTKSEASLHSDNVNMVKDLFDGKIID